MDNPIIICPTCHEEGKKSTVRKVRKDQNGRLLDNIRAVNGTKGESFWDEDGKHHAHYTGVLTPGDFRCSNGHTWRFKPQPVPCHCGWGGIE